MAPTYGPPTQARPAPLATPYGAPHAALWARPGGANLGKTRSPVAVVVLGLVPFGIYVYVWLWKTAQEVDAFAALPGNAMKKTRMGVILGFVFLATYLVGLVLTTASAPTTPSSEPSGAFIVGFLFFFLAFPLGIVSLIFLLMGLWRVWKVIAADQQSRMEPTPIKPELLLVLMFIPFGNVISIFLTQKALNRTWAAYGGASARA